MSRLLNGLLFLTVCSCYKIVIFAPEISNSQVGWNKRFAETLAKAGHDVTVILLQSMEDAEKDVQFSKDVKVGRRGTDSAMEADRIDSIFLNFWVTAHLLTALDPCPGVSRLLDADPPLPHHGTQLQVMVNSNELYELPRPTLSKVVHIGGLGVEYEDAKPLQGEFKQIADSGKGVVVMSFGSVAHAEMMPEQWKTAFLNAFAQYPEHEFVIKYANDDLKHRLPPNVHTYRWLPQADLLLHPSTKAFISHGGYNSIQESINFGVPLITIPLFGDQFKNSKIAAKHGFAVNLKKGTLDEASIAAALKEVLNNETNIKEF
ncbi:hypothetical protein Y032_0552g3346 [Ancylostoma ceylanicum]|uniref:UDP-glucuronosyltransferase n=2 Tax=Ancylostoma ceylanicum TaxID=53326 RepID=A0A016WS91_9BILA|nr:hypothetical protein Y032_0552g3346 [Ancylostoma ceylanicum]